MVRLTCQLVMKSMKPKLLMNCSYLCPKRQPYLIYKVPKRRRNYINGGQQKTKEGHNTLCKKKDSQGQVENIRPLGVFKFINTISL